MKRNLLTQMRNEWKENVWLVIELAVVLLVVWGLSTMLYTKLLGLTEPKGFDPENVYSISVFYMDKGSPDYVAVEDDRDAYYEDLYQLYTRLKENVNVEAIALHQNAMPYSMSQNDANLTPTEGNDTVFYRANFRYATPDIINVLGVKSLTGTPAEKLIEMLKKGELLITDSRPYQKLGRDPLDLIGKTVYYANDSSRRYRIGDVVQQIRRTEYEINGEYGNVIYPLDEQRPGLACNILLKLKPGTADKFYEEFQSNKELRTLRNVYLSDLTSLMEHKELIQKNDDVKVRIYVSGVFLLLVTIFLGLLGSFWFRVQQRISEIAIRKVCGASRKQIFARLITEGLILLFIATIIVSAIIWPVADKFIDKFIIRGYTFMNDYYDWMNNKVFLLMEICSLVLIALGIIFSLWYPARKAMQIEPAEAIKSE